MCICFFQVNSPDSPYPFIFCGNRDEFFSRESIALHEWTNVENVYAGKDAVRGGTWLGIQPSSKKNKYRFAVVHNFRHNDPIDTTKLSRGDLPINFLKGDLTSKEYAKKVAEDGHKYLGFTLIVVDENGAFFTSNKGSVQKLTEGIYSLSNALLDTPWPKNVFGKETFRKILNIFPLKSKTDEDVLIDKLVNQVLMDNTLFPYPLPGILPPHTEIGLSSVFIEPYQWGDFGFYGTRMQTVVFIRSDGSTKVKERTLDTYSPVKDWTGKWSSIAFDSYSKIVSKL